MFNDLKAPKLDAQLINDLHSSNRDVFDKKIVEEPMELALGYMHFLDGKITKYDLAKEVADVLVQIEKIFYRIPKFKPLVQKELDRVIQGLEDEVYYNPNYELEQTLKRIREEAKESPIPKPE